MSASASWRRGVAIATVGSFVSVTAVTLIVPFLPVFVAQMGVSDPASIARWSGMIYAATFLGAAIAAPIWGSLADRRGAKVMLVRASLGVAGTTALMGLVRYPQELALLRLLTGLLGGYASASLVLVARWAPPLTLA